MTENLKLWDSLCTTPVTATKPFSGRGGFKGTAISAIYIIKTLTETFGPCGKGWVFVLEQERIEEGHTLAGGVVAKVHIVRGHLNYMLGDEWFSTSPQFGQTMFVDSNKNGTFTDEEAPKKSITDCIGKCASLLGIGADIFMGLYDDNKYVNARKEDARAAQGPSPPSPPPAPPLPTGGSGASTLTEAEERALDRQSMKDMRHETPEHDPVTGEVGPRELSTKRNAGGQIDWRAWGVEMAGVYTGAASLAELSSWMEANNDNLNRIETADPKAYGRLMQIYRERAAALKAS